MIDDENWRHGQQGCNGCMLEHQSAHPSLARIRLDAAILQDREPLFALSPCTLRTRSSCLCWQIKWKDLTYLLDHSLKTRDLMQAHAIDAITASIYLCPYAWSQHSFEVVGGWL